MDYLILDEDNILTNETGRDIEGSNYLHTLKVKLVNEEYIINNLTYSIPEMSVPPDGVVLSKDGVLSGRLNPVIPKDIPRINIDGSGRENIKRFDGNEKIVNFKIRIDYNIDIPIDTTESSTTETSTEEPVIPEPIIGYQNIDVGIRIVKNNDVDNYVFMVGYIMSEQSVVNGVVVEHTINNNGVTYNKNNVLDLLKNHPGPFGV